MNVAIIGCGYVGITVARHWQQENHYRITATTTTPERVTELQQVAQQVVVTKGNDATALRSVVQDQDIILVSVAPSRVFGASSYEQTYLHTAKNLVNVLSEAPTVKQIIYTGSYSVYGDRNGAWVDEESPVAPANQNGQILCDTEQVLLTAASAERRVCILRLGGIYGPERELTKIFSRVFGTTRTGTGDDFTNWIHLDDIVLAVAFAASQRLSGIYNLVGDRPSTSRDLLNYLCQQHNLPPVKWDATAASVRPYNSRVNNRKLKAAGYNFVHPEIWDKRR